VTAVTAFKVMQESTLCKRAFTAACSICSKTKYSSSSSSTIAPQWQQQQQRQQLSYMPAGAADAVLYTQELALVASKWQQQQQQLAYMLDSTEAPAKTAAESGTLLRQEVTRCGRAVAAAGA
jgi:hypothetical protein